MEDASSPFNAETGAVAHSSTKTLLLVIAGTFMFVALLAGLYLTQRPQNISKRAETIAECVGDDKLIADQCPVGFTPIGAVGGIQSGGDGSTGEIQIGGTGTKLCCQKKVVPTTEVQPTSPVPTDAPTPKPNEPTPLPTAVQPTSVVPTEGFVCREAPNFTVDIIINNCPGCLQGGSPQ